MRVILLKISEDIRTKIIFDSILNNFQGFDSFYFVIPPKLSISDQEHLQKQGSQFFQSQFNVNIQNRLSIVLKRDIRKVSQFSLELSWEIFYKFNNWIRVCEGIFDEDLDWFISGFNGKILDFYTDGEKCIFLIVFSYHSISKIPVEHLKTISRNNSPFFTFLEPELIMPDNGPDNLQTDEKQRMAFLLQFTDFNQYPSENLDFFSDILIFWEELFRSNLKKPEKAKIASSEINLPCLVEIPYYCERFGVWGTFLIGDKKVDIPLLEVEEFPDNDSLNNLCRKYQQTMSLMLPY